MADREGKEHGCMSTAYGSSDFTTGRAGYEALMLETPTSILVKQDH